MPARSKSRSEAHPRGRRTPRIGGAAGPGRRRFDCHLHLSRYWPDPERNRYGPQIRFDVVGLLAELDAAGIGHGLLLQLNDSPSVAETLREGEELKRASGGRLLRSSTVDPTSGPGAVPNAVHQWSSVGDLAALKLYPGYQRFYVHDPRLDPLYEFAARRRLVVMVHQGDTLDPRGLVKFTRPIDVDEVAVRYRDVRFVICHFGNPWIDEAAEIVYKNENVYADTSGILWSPRLPLFPAMFHRAQARLANAIAEIGDVGRILYGSDWPLESIQLAVELIEGLELSASDRERILGGNARGLFGLDDPGPASTSPAPPSTSETTKL